MEERPTDRGTAKKDEEGGGRKGEEEGGCVTGSSGAR